MIREVVLDTETTGVDARKGDRVVEIGCVELINHCTTGKTFHTYLNPQRPVSEGAFGVHGLSDAFLADKPLFAAVSEPFLAFIAGARLIIHNAPFDVGFLDMELARAGKPLLDGQLVVDTLIMARRKHPGASNSLDALCSRYGIDTSRRVKHGALLDAEILSEVYVELLGGRQATFGLAAPDESRRDKSLAGGTSQKSGQPVRSIPLKPRLTDQEREAHAAFIGTLAGTPVWKTG
jgi:DNA polymerase III subunit epsilon